MKQSVEVYNTALWVCQIFFAGRWGGVRWWMERGEGFV